MKGEYEAGVLVISWVVKWELTITVDRLQVLNLSARYVKLEVTVTRRVLNRSLWSLEFGSSAGQSKGC